MTFTGGDEGLGVLGKTKLLLLNLRVRIYIAPTVSIDPHLGWLSYGLQFQVQFLLPGADDSSKCAACVGAAARCIAEAVELARYWPIWQPHSSPDAAAWQLYYVLP